MHRKLWLNDPDCLMLRSDETRMSARAIEAWARAVGVSGGMALVSDDLALLGDDARHLLDNVLTQGREADAEAVAGNPARCSDLMTAAVPGLLSTSTLDLVADPSEPTSTLRRRLAVSGAQEPFDGA
jgi:alpha-galactosidase